MKKQKKKKKSKKKPHSNYDPVKLDGDHPQRQE